MYYTYLYEKGVSPGRPKIGCTQQVKPGLVTPPWPVRIFELKRADFGIGGYPKNRRVCVRHGAYVRHAACPPFSTPINPSRNLSKIETENGSSGHQLTVDLPKVRSYFVHSDWLRKGYAIRGLIAPEYIRDIPSDSLPIIAGRIKL